MQKLLLSLLIGTSLLSCTKTTFYHYPCVVWVGKDTLAVSYVRHSLLTDTLLFRDHTVNELKEVKFTFLYGITTLPVMSCSGVTTV